VILTTALKSDRLRDFFPLILTTKLSAVGGNKGLSRVPYNNARRSPNFGRKIYEISFPVLSFDFLFDFFYVFSR
jgi:hypothetical protein